MHSPGKDDKLLVQDEPLEIGRDGMPQEIWDDMVKNERFIYVSLMFLNGSVLWAYYSCLSAQNFYTERFSESDLDFSFLTTLCTAWPMVIGQGVQMIFGLDKKISQAFRVHVGYAIFMAMAILIMVFSAIHFDNQNVGAALVLVCFGLIGFGNSLSEATYYTFSALFPIPKFTNGVQIGNTIAGIMNITIATIIRLAVGGVHQTKSSTNLSFYLFFGLLCVVLVVALALYRYLITLPSVKFLMDRNEQSAKDEGLDTQSVGATLANLWRILKIIWVPAAAQFIIFFVSLAVFPGFGCTASRNLFPPYMTGDNSLTSSWYCSPGIIGSYNYGDFFGRVLCTAAVYKVVSMNLALGLSVLRLAFIPLLLMGVAGTSLYSFPDGSFGALAFNISLNFLIGISTGLLATVTIGKAPRMLKPEDRESGGALMVFFLFFGIAAGSTFGFLVNENGWLGL